MLGPRCGRCPGPSARGGRGDGATWRHGGRRAPRTSSTGARRCPRRLASDPAPPASRAQIGWRRRRRRRGLRWRRAPDSGLPSRPARPGPGPTLGSKQGGRDPAWSGRGLALLWAQERDPDLQRCGEKALRLHPGLLLGAGAAHRVPPQGGLLGQTPAPLERSHRVRVGFRKLSSSEPRLKCV